MSLPYSTNAGRFYKPLSMKELIRTNDPATLAFATALLDGEGIDHFVMDVHIGTLIGSIGILPHRLMVRDQDITQARRAMRDNGIIVEK